jgi:DNA polymerase III sliding clamp (beta) subunit (PCNA family)
MVSVALPETKQEVNFKVKVPRAMLELHRFCSSDDDRIKFHFIQVVIKPTKIVAVATDGHRLTKVEIVNPEPFEEDKQSIEFFLHRTEAKSALRTLKGFKHIDDVEFDGKIMTIGNVSMKIEGSPIQYPDWEQVMPKDTERTNNYSINMSYVGDIGSYLKACCIDNQIAKHVGGAGDLGPVEYTVSNPDFEATFVIMPCRM